MFCMFISHVLSPSPPPFLQSPCSFISPCPLVSIFMIQRTIFTSPFPPQISFFFFFSIYTPASPPQLCEHNPISIPPTPPHNHYYHHTTTTTTTPSNRLVFHSLFFSVSFFSLSLSFSFFFTCTSVYNTSNICISNLLPV